MNESLEQTKRLVGVIRRLRKECPWDRKQTHQSLVPYMLEEAYEAVEAMESKNGELLKEELGDVLLQVVLHSTIAEETNEFDFEQIAKTLADKMIHRHPHVFANTEVKDEKEHLRNWAKLKGEEKEDTSLLSGVPKAMPALQRCQKLSAKAAAAGFDWTSLELVLAKVKEEVAELEEELERKEKDPKAIELELGDILFTTANVARHLKLDAETALRKSTEKFYRRFEKVEAKVRESNRTIDSYSLEELEELWEQGKRLA